MTPKLAKLKTSSAPPPAATIATFRFFYYPFVPPSFPMSSKKERFRTRKTRGSGRQGNGGDGAADSRKHRRLSYKPNGRLRSSVSSAERNFRVIARGQNESRRERERGGEGRRRARSSSNSSSDHENRRHRHHRGHHSRHYSGQHRNDDKQKRRNSRVRSRHWQQSQPSSPAVREQRPTSPMSRQNSRASSGSSHNLTANPTANSVVDAPTISAENHRNPRESNDDVNNDGRSVSPVSPDDFIFIRSGRERSSQDRRRSSTINEQGNNSNNINTEHQQEQRYLSLGLEDMIFFGEEASQQVRPQVSYQSNVRLSSSGSIPVLRPTSFDNNNNNNHRNHIHNNNNNNSGEWDKAYEKYSFSDCKICLERIGFDTVRDKVQLKENIGGEHFSRVLCSHLGGVAQSSSRKNWPAIPRGNALSSGHSSGGAFCAGCLREYAETQAKAGKFEILCPMPQCKTRLYLDDLCKLVGPETFAAYQERLKANHAHRIKALSKKEVKEMLGAKVIACGRCKVLVSKSDGCDTMRCTCGHKFSYNGALRSAGLQAILKKRGDIFEEGI